MNSFDFLPNTIDSTLKTVIYVLVLVHVLFFVVWILILLR